MSWTLEGNKTGPRGCVCLESGVQGRVGWTGGGGAPGLGDWVEPREAVWPAALGLPLASMLGPRTPWIRGRGHP